MRYYSVFFIRSSHSTNLCTVHVTGFLKLKRIYSLTWEVQCAETMAEGEYRWGRSDKREALKGKKNGKKKQKQKVGVKWQQLPCTVQVLFEEQPLDGNRALRSAWWSLALMQHVYSAGCAFVSICMWSRLQDSCVAAFRAFCFSFGKFASK